MIYAYPGQIWLFVGQNHESVGKFLKILPSRGQVRVIQKAVLKNFMLWKNLPTMLKIILDNRAFRNINGFLVWYCSFWVKIGKMSKCPKIGKRYVAKLLHKTLNSIFSRSARWIFSKFTFLEPPKDLLWGGGIENPWTFFFLLQSFQENCGTGVLAWVS